MIEVTMSCQRVDCDAQETAEVSSAHEANKPVASFMPDGWGWDWVGHDTVLHCDKHRPELPKPEEIDEPSQGAGAQRVSRLG